MASYKRVKPVFEQVSSLNHPDYEIKDTRVSDYLRKYGSGQLDDLPTTSRPEITDNRSVDQMLSEPVESMSTETIDVLMEIDRNRESFEKAAATIKMTQAKKKKFDDAVAVLRSKDAPHERKREAYSVLLSLEEQGYISRARV